MAEKKKPGRRNRSPDKLTPDVQKLIVEAVAACAPRMTAAERAGVTDRVLRKWMARGAKDRSGVYRSFYSAVKKAEAEALLVRIARIGKAAQGGQVVERTTKTTKKKDGTVETTTVEKYSRGEWTADAWALERRDPDNYALHRKRDIEEAVKKVLEKHLENQLAAPRHGAA